MNIVQIYLIYITLNLKHVIGIFIKNITNIITIITFFFLVDFDKSIYLLLWMKILDWLFIIYNFCFWLSWHWSCNRHWTKKKPLLIISNRWLISIHSFIMLYIIQILVDGYNRSIEKLLNGQRIPTDINMICFKFYFLS